MSKRHVGSVKGVKQCTVIPLTDQNSMYVRGVKSGICSFHTTLYTEVSVTHVGGVKGVLYSVYSGLLPLPGGKAI